MNIQLVRVGADQTAAGGHWNGAIDSESGEFVYVAIPETAPLVAICTWTQTSTI
jgi:hypothetical protein